MATLRHFVLAPSRIAHNSTRTLLKPWSTQSFTRVFARASSASITVTQPGLITDVDKVTANENVLACPICYEPFESISATKLSVNTSAQSSFQCCTCWKEYFGNETHLNLTVASGSSAYDESMPASTEIFRTPVVSFLYERGWRQTFSVLGGFPGAEKEFEMMKDYLKPVLGGNIIDASCGSGMFSRLFAKSGLFSRVVALDFSENMLQECFKFIKEEENFPTENLILVRADISRLPFATSSIDAVHAGAALHCWPSPSAANIGTEFTRGNTKRESEDAEYSAVDGKQTIRLQLVYNHRNFGKFWIKPQNESGCDLYDYDHVFCPPHVKVAEISRVLRPGGVFVATTYILDGLYSLIPLLGSVRQIIGEISGSHIFLSEGELKELCAACGLLDFTIVRNRRFVMISARKPY